MKTKNIIIYDNSEVIGPVLDASHRNGHTVTFYIFLNI